MKKRKQSDRTGTSPGIRDVGQSIDKTHGSEVAEYVTRGVKSDEELIAANELMAATQTPPNTECMRWLKETGPNWPGYRREHTRVHYINSEMAGALRIQPFKLRIGRARLTAGGIGWVSTEETHRNRGVCGALMRDALDYMTKSGFDVSLLFGIPNLYQKFGYVSILPEYAITFDISGRTQSEPCVARVTWEDAKTLRSLHERHESCVSCSVVRDAKYFRTLFECTSRTIRYYPDWAATVKVFDARGRIVGYLMSQLDSEVLHIKEMGVDGPTHFDTILDAASAMARRKGRTRVRFHLPPSHPFARYLRDYTCVHEMRTFRNAEGMMRVLDTEKTFQQMIPEWETALRDSGMWQSGTDLVLAVDEERYMFSLRRGSLHVERTDGRAHIRVTGQQFCRMLAGFTSASDVEVPRGSENVERRRLIECLFPERTPFIWPIDHF
ncbi:MAG: GNAT family N-acetyltransferase [Candidatus Hydrogenedentes bacterium]|nr:GNAT family N-acetyltransferase [Candidatus Hydrogenedentota bacterium]